MPNAYTGDVSELSGTLALAYGAKVVSGHVVQKVTVGEGDNAQTTVIVWLGEGVWNRIRTAYWGGGVIPESDYHFHNGYLSDNMNEAVFANGEWTQGVDPWNYGGQTYSGTAYVIVRLPAGVTKDDDLSRLKFVCECLRVANYNANGEQLDKNGNVVGTATEPPKEQYFFYSTNPALVVADLLLVRRGLPKSRINWSAWVAWRDFNNVDLPWQGGEVAGRPSYNEATLLNVVLGVDGYISKPYGSLGAWDGRAVTNERIPVGVDGYYEVDPGVGTMLMGLTTLTAPTSPDFIEIFLRFQADGTVYVQAGGQILATLANNWTANDRFKIGKEAGQFKLYKNGQPYATNVTLPAVPNADLYGVSGFYTRNSEQLRAAFQPVGSAARSRKQFECGLAFPDRTDFSAALEAALFTSCANVQNADGKLVFLPPAMVSAPRASVYDFNMSNIIEGTFKFWRMAREQRPTKMKGKFRNQDVVTLREDDVEANRDELADALGRENSLPDIYLGTMTKGQAQCVVNYHMRLQSDLDLYCSFQSDGRSWKVLPGDVVTVTHDVPGWQNVKFLVIDAQDESGVDTPDLRTFTLQIYTDDMYDPDGDQTPLRMDVQSVVPAVIAPPPAATILEWTANGGFNANRDYTVRLQGRVKFNYEGYPHSQRAAVYLTRPNEFERFSHFIYPGDNNEATVEFQAEKSGQHTLRIVSQNTYGVTDDTIVHPSAVANAQNVVFVLSAPSNFTGTFGGNTAQYRWTLPTTGIEFVKEYEIWKSANTSTFPDTTNPEANRVWKGISDRWVEQITAADPTSVVRWLRAVDYMGNASPWVLLSNAGGVLPVAVFPTFSNYSFDFDATEGAARLLHTITVSANGDGVRLYQILDGAGNVVAEGRNQIIIEPVGTGTRAFTRQVRAILNTGHIGAAYPTTALTRTISLPSAPSLTLSQQYASSVVLNVVKPADFNANIHSGLFLRVEVSDTAAFTAVRESFVADIVDDKVTIQGQRSRYQTVYVRARYEDPFGVGANSANYTHTFEALANGDLGVGSVDFSQLVAGAVRGAAIQDNAVTTAKIAPLNITNALLAANSVDAAKIVSGAVDYAKFASGLRPIETLAALPALPNATYPANALVILSTDNRMYKNVGNVWVDSLRAADLTGQITTTQISDDAITTPKIAANAVTANTIAANAVTAGKIAANAVTANEIAANAIIAGKIAANAVDANAIAANAVTANKIAAGAVTAQKLTIGNFAAVNTDPGTSDITAWTWDNSNTTWNPQASATIVAVSDGVSGRTAMQNVAGTRTLMYSKPVPYDPNKQYRISGWFRGVGGGSVSYLALMGFDANGNVVMGNNGGWYAQYYFGGSNPPTTPGFTPTASWVQKVGVFGAGTANPLGATVKTIAVGTLLHWDVPSAAGVVQVQDLRLEEMVTSAVIADGAVVANKIAADAVTANKIAAGSITADKLTIGSLSDSLIYNHSFEAQINGMPEGWQRVHATPNNYVVGAWSADTGFKSEGFRSLQINSPYNAVGSRAFPVVPGAQYLLRFKAYSPSAVSAADTFIVQINETTGDLTKPYLGYTGAQSPSTYQQNLPADVQDRTSATTPVQVTLASLNAGWTTYEYTYTVPTNVRFVNVAFLCWHNAAAQVHVDEVEFRRLVRAVHIEDNAITAGKISARTITADRIVLGAITDSEVSGTAAFVRNASQKFQTPIHGGGQIAFSAGGVLTWTQRFIAIPTALSATGYFDFPQPTGGVTLNSWEGLYFRLPIGGAYNAAGNPPTNISRTAAASGWFVAGETTIQGLMPPAGYLDFLLASRNGDTGVVFLFDGREIKPGQTIDSAQFIPNGSIIANHMAANSITAGAIAADAIIAGKVAANAITAREIAANAITANKIAAGAVTADKISAAVGQFGIVMPTQIVANDYVRHERAAAHAEQAMWMSRTNLVQDGAGGLVKTTGANAWDAAAVSTRGIYRGNGYMEFTMPLTAPPNPHYAMIGLVHTFDIISYTGLKYAWYPHYDATIGYALQIYESGTVISTGRTWSPGDVFRIAVEGTNIVYSHNGTVVRTVAGTNGYPRYPMRVQASVYQLNNSVPTVFLYGILTDGALVAPQVNFNHAENANTNGSLAVLSSDGTYFTTPTGVNVGLRGVETLSGDGYVEMRAPAGAASTHGWVAGFAQSTSTGVSDTSVVYGIHHGVDGRMYARDPAIGWVDSGYVYNTAGGDLYRVGIENGVVVYRHHGQTPAFRTSPTAPTYPLRPMVNSRGAVTLNSGLVMPNLYFNKFGTEGQGWRLHPKQGSAFAGMGEFNDGITIRNNPLTEAALRSLGSLNKDGMYRGRDRGVVAANEWMGFNEIKRFPETDDVWFSFFFNTDVNMGDAANADSTNWVRLRVFNKFGEEIKYMYYPWHRRGVAAWGFHTRNFADPTEEAVYSFEVHNAYGYSRRFWYSTANWMSNRNPGWQSRGQVAPAVWVRRSDVPNNLQATTASESSVVLTWQPAPGSTSQGVYYRRFGSSNWINLTTALSGTATTYTVTGLSPNTLYEFISHGSMDNSWSETKTARTFPAPLAAPTLASPAGLSAAAASTSAINLNWTNGAATNTEIYRSGDNGATWALVTTVGSGVTTYQNTGLVASTMYSYRVRHNNGSITSAYSNVASATTQAPQPPASAPHSCSAVATGYYSIDVTWQNPGDAATLDYSTDQTFATGVTSVANATSPRSITGLADGTTYYFRVRNSTGTSNTAVATTDVYVPPDPDPYCVVYGTRFDALMNNEWVKLAAREIAAGMQVRSIETRTGEEVVGTVKRVFKGHTSRVYTLTTETGESLSCSPSHPVISGVGDVKGKRADLYKTGDTILVYNEALQRAVESRIRSVEWLDIETPVLTVEMENEEHTFVSDGIVSHNARQKPINTL